MGRVVLLRARLGVVSVTALAFACGGRSTRVDGDAGGTGASGGSIGVGGSPGAGGTGVGGTVSGGGSTSVGGSVFLGGGTVGVSTGGTGDDGSGGTSAVGCYYGGGVYVLGSTFAASDGCNVCECTSSGVECSMNDCGPKALCENLAKQSTAAVESALKCTPADTCSALVTSLPCGCQEFGTDSTVTNQLLAAWNMEGCANVLPTSCPICSSPGAYHYCDPTTGMCVSSEIPPAGGAAGVGGLGGGGLAGMAGATAGGLGGQSGFATAGFSGSGAGGSTGAGGVSTAGTTSLGGFAGGVTLTAGAGGSAGSTL